MVIKKADYKSINYYLDLPWTFAMDKELDPLYGELYVVG